MNVSVVYWSGTSKTQTMAEALDDDTLVKCENAGKELVK